MRTELLEYLLEISRSGSINKAANNLFMTQPALNTAIKSFEKELGFPVLKRSKNGTSLTPAGEKIVADSKIILDYIKGWDVFKESDNSNISDTLHIIAYEVVYQRYLIHVLKKLNQKYPNLKIHCHTCIRNDFKKVLTDKYSFAILGFSTYNNEEKDVCEVLQKARYKTEPLVPYQFDLFLSAQNDLALKNNITPRDLAGLTVAVPTTYNRPPYADIIELLGENNILYIENIDTILSLIKQDQVVSFLSSLRLIDHYDSSGKHAIISKPVSGMSFPHRQHLIYPNRILSIAEKIVLDAIRECYLDLN